MRKLTYADFGTAGYASICFGTNGVRATKVIAQADGRYVIVGSQSDTFEGFVARVWN